MVLSLASRAITTEGGIFSRFLIRFSWFWLRMAGLATCKGGGGLEVS
jgi:hypothetical protein